jgi:hypothetical protein
LCLREYAGFDDGEGEFHANRFLCHIHNWPA